MELAIYQVDAFTSQPFKGNPAAVCITEQPLDEALMFSIAAEMAVSETAFLTLNDLRLRWFTPKIEVNLCGHGTLAVAHILKELGHVRVGDVISFNTLSGPLSIYIAEKEIEMDFPATEIDFSISHNKALLSCFDIKASELSAFGLFDCKHLIVLDNEQKLLDLTPNFTELKNLQGRGVVITAKSHADNVDFISRYFAPWVGVDEDPVTGSAHCALAMYWGNKLNRTELTAYQASARGGYVKIVLLPKGRIKIIGQAITTLKGTLCL